MLEEDDFAAGAADDAVRIPSDLEITPRSHRLAGKDFVSPHLIRAPSQEVVPHEDEHGGSPPLRGGARHLPRRDRREALVRHTQVR